MSEPTAEHDIVVIGSGPGGEEICRWVCSRSDLDIALIEDRLVGGECAFWACMPSKALLRPDELHRETARVPGVPGDEDELDVARILRRRDEVVHDLDDEGKAADMRERDVTIYRGHGRLEGERRVRVGNELLAARQAVVIATGSRPAIPPIPGLEEAAVWTNRELTLANKQPQSLIVLGGGYVGCEMAQAWASLGTRVTVLEREDHLMDREEPFAGQILADTFEELGIDVRTSADVTRVKPHGDRFACELDSGGEVRAQRLLASLGRTPNTDDLGLRTLDITPGGHIEVDDELRCPQHPWLFVVGDANGRAELTHEAKYESRFVAELLCGTQRRTFRPTPGGPPRCAFTDPQVAGVGYTLAAAKEAGLDVRCVDLETQATAAGSSFYGKGGRNQTRFVVDNEREVLVGATFVGPTISEMLHAATIAIVGEVPILRLADAVPAFPTRSEIWVELVDETTR